MILWSGNFIAAKALHKSISPISLSFFRWSVATIILFPIAFKKFIAEWDVILPHFKYLTFTALTGVTLFNTLLYVAGKYTSATNLAIIGTTAAPVFVLMISGLFLKQKISLTQIAGAVICILGVLILISKGRLDQLSNFRFSEGDKWIFLAALSFAVYTILVRKKPQELSSFSFLFSIFLIGTLFLIPAYIFDLANGNPIQWDKKIILSILYLGIGASVIAFLCWNISIKSIGPARTALFGNLIPIFSTIEASLLLDEDFNKITILSMAIILIGILIANLSFFTRGSSNQ